MFHFKQALFRKVKALGLQATYRDNCSIRDFLKEVMCLPFLPAESIRPTFDAMMVLVWEDGRPPLVKFMEYIEKYWVRNGRWMPRDWSCYMETVRTNNDVEGWHSKFNRRVGKAKPSVYELIPKLYDDSKTVAIQVQF